MKTITLKEAYAKAPKRPAKSDFVGNIEMPGGLEWAHCQFGDCSSTDEQDAHNAALLTHAFNVLPEVVKELAEAIAIIEYWKDKDAALERDWQHMKSVLTKANQVEVPE